MQSLPRAAQAYLIVICVLGAALTFLVSFLTLPGSGGNPAELFLFILAAAVMGGQKVKLLKNLLNEEAGSMSLGFAVTFAALIRFGPSFAVLIGAISSLSGCLYPKRQPLYQLCFNVALVSFESAVGGLVFLYLNGWTMALRPLETFGAIIGSVLVIFFVNTGGVATIICLCTEQKLISFWKSTFLWTAPSYLAGATVGALAMILFNTRSTEVLILFISPVAYLTYVSYTSYTLRSAEKLRHVEELQTKQAQLAELYLATIKSLALAIDAKDQYTHQHILRVQTYSVAIAKEMGLEGSELEAVNTGALLHDIGKLGVPEYVLLKPGRLTADEFDKIKKHPEIGAAILDPVEFPWPVLPVVRHHHEKWDGSGYPDGLKGEQIPLTARIMAAADVYDALTSTRSYRKGWTHERAKETIIKDAGTHFDPRVVEAFARVIDGVVEQMAEQGEGPLARTIQTAQPTKAAEAAREISRASSELWALYEVAQSLSTSLGVQETINILAHKLEAIFPDACSAFLLAQQDNKLMVKAAAGINKGFFMNAHTMRSDSVSQSVLGDHASFLGEFDPEDLMLTSCEFEEWVPLRTSLIVPIIHQGEPLGTINLYHQREAAFSDHDRDLLEMIAERSAMALYNGMLYERTKGHAIKDPLTGAYNIRYFTEQVERRCREKSAVGQPEGFAIFCLDLDSFKPINDNFGHQKGDDVLREVAQIIGQQVPSNSLVARYGGDEFVILLENAEEAKCEQFCFRLIDAIRKYDPNLVHYKLGKLSIDASMGFARYPADGTDYASLIAAADSRMYQLKTEHKLGALASKERKPGKTRAA